MKSIRFLAPLLVSSLLLAGCGNTTPVASNTNSAPAAGAGMVVANPPAGCPAKSTITLKTTDFPDTTFTAESSYLATYASMKDSVEVAIANYAMAPDSFSTGATDAGHLYAAFRLETTDKSPVGIGTYTRKSGSKMKVASPDLRSASGLVGFIGDAGSVELKYADKQYACGTVNIDDGYAKIQGEFISKVIAR